MRDTDVEVRGSSLSGRHVLLGVTGGIAAVDTVRLARELRRHGAQVSVIMTPSAQEFINNTVVGNQILTFSGNRGEGGGIAIDGAGASSFWMFNNIIGGNKSCNQPFCEEDVDSNLRYFPGFGSPMGMIASTMPVAMPLAPAF